MTSYRRITVGLIEDGYAIEATAAALDNGPRVIEFNPLVEGGDPRDSAAALLHWRHASGAVLRIVVRVRPCTPAAIAMCGIEHGDLVRVEGRATQLLGTAVGGELVVIDPVEDIEVIRRAAGNQQARGATREGHS